MVLDYDTCSSRNGSSISIALEAGNDGLPLGSHKLCDIKLQSQTLVKVKVSGLIFFAMRYRIVAWFVCTITLMPNK